MPTDEIPQDVQRRCILTRPARTRRDASLDKARHVCERRRESEAAVFCENAAEGRLQHPDRPEQ